MKRFGIDLKAERERQGTSLNQIAEETHISLRHLMNLEEGHYEELPGGVYNRAFLRSYCEYLGIDSHSMLQRYERETYDPADRGSKIMPAPPVPIQEPFSLHPAFVWGVALVLSVAGLYYSRSWIASVFSPYFSSPPSSNLRVEAEPAVRSPNQREPVQVLAADILQSLDKTSQGESPMAGAANQTEFSGLLPAGANLQLNFEVVDSCWVSLFSDGNHVFVKLLEPGESPTFAADKRFYIILGNAAGVNLTINGKPIKPLGKPGEVVKMLIDEENMQNLLMDNTMG
jgi:cytoskeletal protein RodZ